MWWNLSVVQSGTFVSFGLLYIQVFKQRLISVHDFIWYMLSLRKTSYSWILTKRITVKLVVYIYLKHCLILHLLYTWNRKEIIFLCFTGRMWCHCRMVYLPMSYLYGKRFVGPITPTVLSLRKELYNIPYHDIDWNEARNLCAKVSDACKLWKHYMSIVSIGFYPLWGPQ